MTVVEMADGWFALESAGGQVSATRFKNKSDAETIKDKLTQTTPHGKFIPVMPKPRDDMKSISAMRKENRVLASATTFRPNPDNCTGVYTGRNALRRAKAAAKEQARLAKLEAKRRAASNVDALLV